MLQDSTEEPSSKRERYDYRDGSGPSSGQPPPSYSAQRVSASYEALKVLCQVHWKSITRYCYFCSFQPSTQTLTISDISNVPATSLPCKWQHDAYNYTICSLTMLLLSMVLQSEIYLRHLGEIETGVHFYWVFGLKGAFMFADVEKYPL